MKRNKISGTAGGIFTDIGVNGMILAIPRSGHGPKLIPCPVPGFLQSRETEERSVDVNAVRELLESGLITRLTETRNNRKAGWRELKLPGEKFNLYCCTQ